MKPTMKQMKEFHEQVERDRISAYDFQEFIHNAPGIAAQRGLRESIGFARNAIEKQSDPFLRCKLYLRIAEVAHDAKDLVAARNTAAEVNPESRGSKWEALALVAEAYAKEGHLSIARSVAESIGQSEPTPFRYIAFAKIAYASKNNRHLKNAQDGLKRVAADEYRDKLLEEIAVALAYLGKDDAGRETARTITCPKHKALTFVRMMTFEFKANDPEEICAAAKLIAETQSAENGNCATLNLLVRILADNNSLGTAVRVLELIKDRMELASTLAYIAPRSGFPDEHIAKARGIADLLVATDNNARELYRRGSAFCAIAKATKGVYGVSETVHALSKLASLRNNAVVSFEGRRFHNALLVEFVEMSAMNSDLEDALETAKQIDCPYAQTEAYVAIARVCSQFISGAGKEPSY